MKNSYFVILATVMAAMLFLPLVSSAVTPNENLALQTVSPISEDNVKVKITESGEVLNVSVEDYVTLVVAAEMSADYCEEALKAQAVAARTFLYYKKIQNAGENYDITDDFSTDQTFLTKEKLREKWGESFEDSFKKISDAVNLTAGEVLLYDGAPIFAAYHAVSSGRTETALNVWGKDYPYIVSVDSIGDLLCPEYLTSVTVTPEDFKKAFGDEVAFSSEAKNWVGDSENTESGTVTKILVCEKEFTGAKIREKFSLKSSSFDLTFDGTNFVFTVRGYGHGVGMSQYGANYMAQQGSDYKEILNWYYKDCKIEKALG